jgi:hypothetical protein
MDGWMDGWMEGWIDRGMGVVVEQKRRKTKARGDGLR